MNEKIWKNIIQNALAQGNLWKLIHTVTVETAVIVDDFGNYGQWIYDKEKNTISLREC